MTAGWCKEAWLMNQIVPSFVAVVAVLALVGCPAPPDTVARLDLERYEGLWYEIAKYPVFFEIGLTGVTAEYTLREDGSVAVVNSGFRGSLDGERETIAGTATVPNPSDPGKLVIRFDQPIAGLFPADYWVIDLAADYSWAVVSGPSRQTLWILSRTPSMDEATYDAITTELDRRGFNTQRLVPMEQPVE
jgi:apolipoprotein D and lipocalin family protein